jgi:hypothetical protein
MTEIMPTPVLATFLEYLGAGSRAVPEPVTAIPVSINSFKIVVEVGCEHTWLLTDRHHVTGW